MEPRGPRTVRDDVSYFVKELSMGLLMIGIAVLSVAVCQQETHREEAGPSISIDQGSHR